MRKHISQSALASKVKIRPLYALSVISPLLEHQIFVTPKRLLSLNLSPMVCRRLARDMRGVVPFLRPSGCSLQYIPTAPSVNTLPQLRSIISFMCLRREYISFGNPEWTKGSPLHFGFIEKAVLAAGLMADAHCLLKMIAVSLWGRDRLPPSSMRGGGYADKESFTTATTVFVSLLLPSLGYALPRPQAADDALATFAKRATPVESLAAGFSAIEASKTEASIAAVESVRNDLTEGGCDDIIVIFARGTYGEGNVGAATSVGPIFFGNLSAVEPGRVIVQGVNDYLANVLGYLAGGSDDGAQNMADMVKLASTQCPSSKVVLSGFSQGAQVVHLAGALIPSSHYSKVAAIVLFGDPYNGDVFPGTLNNNVRTFCHDGDLICDGLPIITDQHGNYADDAPEAAKYVATRV